MTDHDGSPRDRILDTASALFYREGLAAVGVNRVVAESDVAKATLYRHFPSKEALVLAHLARIDERWRTELQRCAAAAGVAPGAQLVGMFDAVLAACARPGFTGCAFLRAAAESALGQPVHEAVAAHKRAVLAWVEGLAVAADAVDPRGLATMLTVLLDGALSDAALQRSAEPARMAQDAARLLVAGGTQRGERPHHMPTTADSSPTGIPDMEETA